MPIEIRQILEETPTRPFFIIPGVNTTEKKNPTGYIKSVLYMIEGYMGPGIFAMGSAFLSSGILLGPLLLVFMAIINLHCQHLVIKAYDKIKHKESVEVLPSFAETVQYTFEDSSSYWLQNHSVGFAILTDIFIVTAEMGFCAVYFLFVSKHFTEIAAQNGWKQDHRIILAILLIPMWLSAFLVNSTLFTSLSVIVNVMIFSGIVVLLYYSTQDLSPITDREFFSDFNRFPMFFGIGLFTLNAITIIIPVRTGMQYPDTFTKRGGVLNMSMGICLILQLLAGFFTLWKWGEDVNGSALLNLPNEELLCEAALIIMSLGVMLAYSLRIYIPFKVLYPRLYTIWGPFESPNTVLCIYRSVAVLITYCLANISSSIATFTAVVGALAGTVLAMMLPALLDLVMFYGELTYLIIFKDAIIIMSALSGLITGTVWSVTALLKEYTTEKS